MTLPVFRLYVIKKQRKTEHGEKLYSNFMDAGPIPAVSTKKSGGQMEQIILNVIIILGIIIAGGFLIFFLGDLLISIIDPDAETKKIKKKTAKEAIKFEQELKKESPEVQEEVLKNSEVQEIMEIKNQEIASKTLSKNNDNNDIVVEEYEPDFDSITEEKEEVIEETEEEIEEESEKINQARQALEERKKEILERMKQTLLSDDDEDENDEEEQIEEEQVEEEIEEENFSVGSDDDEINQELRNEIERQKLEILKQREIFEIEKAKLEKTLEEIKERISSQKSTPTLAKEEYVAMLEEKQKQLDKNEKLLKTCKKEFLPLDKVRKTLDRDEKKLRIKEAKVAKQKVTLYGVNNYADIDEEKAKKLTEELDLLEGLKLSVQHCKDVLESNKDRLPMLEKLFNVLKDQNENLSKEVEELEKNISTIEE